MKKILFSLAFMSVAVGAQQAPMFEVDTSWPKPLPGGWINGQVGGNCVDSHDHSVIVDRRNITEEEQETSMATGESTCWQLRLASAIDRQKLAMNRRWPGIATR